MNICGYIPESVNEGAGLRAVVFISGCRHACPGCFNKDSWNFDAGTPFTDAEQKRIIQDVKHNPLVDGLTLCGGDPFFSAEECIKFVEHFKAKCPDKTIWAYSGFTFEALLANKKRKQLLLLCDILIDGRFIEEQKDVSLLYRGSRNQRIIDVRNSLRSNSIVLYNEGVSC